MIAADDRRRYFFLHVMKTGGTTFRWMHLRVNFPRPTLYPDPERDDMVSSYILVQPLLELPPARRERIRAYSGHFPFVVAELLDPDLTTMTILRDPVERTISHLKHCKRYQEQHRDLSLDEIYEDPFSHASLFRNHQVKIFAMTADDPLESHLDVIDVDDGRLAIAKEHLDRVEVLGMSDELGRFLEELRARFGWTILDQPDQRVSEEPWDVSDALRRRIVEDSAADLEFFEYAREQYRARLGHR